MANERIYNFSAGPSMLPLEVLERAGKEITFHYATLEAMGLGLASDENN